MSVWFLLFLASQCAWILLILRITGYDEKLYNKYIRKPRNRSKTAYANKRIVITGASSGIGAELALQYAKLGAKICIGARRIPNLQQTQKTCLDAGAQACEIAELDVCDAESCRYVQKKYTLSVTSFNISSYLNIKFIFWY